MSASAGLFGFRRSGSTTVEQRDTAAGRPNNRSIIGGVQFGLQPFCYHDLAMTPENRATLVGGWCRTAWGWSSCTRPGSSRGSLLRASAPRPRAKSCARGGSATPAIITGVVKREFDEAGIDDIHVLRQHQRQLHRRRNRRRVRGRKDARRARVRRLAGSGGARRLARSRAGTECSSASTTTTTCPTPMPSTAKRAS